MGGPADEAAQAAVVAAWVRAGPALAEIRRREVAALSDADALAATEVLLSALDLLAPLPLRASSGLVEQQRLLAAGRRRANGIFGTAVQVQRFCDDQGWRFCFIGGLAVQRWGEPRQTLDVDLTLLTGFGHEEPFVDALLDRFDGRIDDARAFALRNRVLLLRSGEGVGIDVALGGLAFEEAAIDEASGWRIGADVVLRTCSAEALIVYKAFAGRPQDWIDVEMVLARQGPAIDTDRVLSDVLPLLELKHASEDLDRLRSLIAAAGLA